MKKHRDEVLAVLGTQIASAEEVDDIRKTAEAVARRWVKPFSGGEESTNGLIYGLVQSGKTGVLTVTGAIAADEGYRTIIVLTTDIDPLYEQTLGRVRLAFPGMAILGKGDFKDADSFLDRIKGNTCAIVTTKNFSMLDTLIQNFKKGHLKGLSCLMIDDEADQASLNTKERKADGTRSKINAQIVELRGYFDKNTYLQVTATPQALFLQGAIHDFRPKFTVLSHPGSEYVGGEDFFSDYSSLIREFSLADIDALACGSQPSPSLHLPKSLTNALDTFVVAATYKRLVQPDQNSAFLCHVSTRTDDHKHIVNLLRKYQSELASDLKVKKAAPAKRLRAAYDDLAKTHADLAKVKFDDILTKAEFYSPGFSVKLVNGATDDTVSLDSPYNLFVGGNKLGRGVTIKNLLVSYYGRNPKKPQADTVLQHARMYGYRRKDFGLLRLFLPPELNTVFKAIHKMERGLRTLIENKPMDNFRGVYVEGNLSATRKNVLAPGLLGMYTGGSNYNPAQIVRDHSVESATSAIDAIVKHIGNKCAAEVKLNDLCKLVELTVPSSKHSEKIWDSAASTCLAHR